MCVCVCVCLCGHACACVRTRGSYVKMILAVWVHCSHCCTTPWLAEAAYSIYCTWYGVIHNPLTHFTKLVLLNSRKGLTCNPHIGKTRSLFVRAVGHIATTSSTAISVNICLNIGSDAQSQNTRHCFAGQQDHLI